MATRVTAPATAQGSQRITPSAPHLLGCDFSSSPSQRKPIVVAQGQAIAGQVQLTGLQYFHSLDAWGQWLAQPLPPDQHWIGAFDLPFGLPRELVQTLGWPLQWHDCIAHYQSLTRAHIRDTFAAFCAARPAGSKLAHRATDGPAGSSPSMKWVNPPVAYMLHAGLPYLLAARWHLPGLHTGHPQRVALEGYPGLLAREVLGRRSYKSDNPIQQTPARQQARAELLTALEQGHTRLGLCLQLTPEQRATLLADGSGDRLDAVLCLLQAAWASARHATGDALYGLPATLDPLEGWIITAPPPPCPV